MQLVAADACPIQEAFNERRVCGITCHTALMIESDGDMSVHCRHLSFDSEEREEEGTRADNTEYARKEAKVQ
ncbi:hypothetical protein MTO96_001069 [Rhipicephalus appendiculatus]